MTPAEMAALDKAREGQTRSAYIKGLIRTTRQEAAPPVKRATPQPAMKEPVQDAPHKHRRENQPYRYEQSGYTRTPIYRCKECQMELSG